MCVRPLAVLVGLSFLLAMPTAEAATSAESAVYVDVKSGESAGAATERYKLYGASHALVIGIDNYSNGWPRLSNAVKDARLVAAELEGRGFEVQLLTDVSGDELRRSLRQFFAIKGRDPEARLFVWYAGHGHTEFGEGYLVPADAPDPSDPNFLVTALHLGDVGSMARIARSKHTYAVFDSCFAGTIFSAARAKPPAAVTQAVVQPVRQFLTSGDADQQVSDDGTFRKLFLAALRGEESADLNGDGYLTGTEIGFYLEDRVVNLTQASQTPRSGKLRDPRFDRGDFIFLLPNANVQVTLVQPQVPEKDDSAFELAFWDSVKNSNIPGDYEAYLNDYPEGKFASLATSRLRTLEGKAVQEAVDRTANAAAEAAKAEEQKRLQENLQKQLEVQEQLQAELEAQRKRQSELEKSISQSQAGGQQSAALPAPGVDLAALEGAWEADTRGWRLSVDIVGTSFELRGRCGKVRFPDVQGALDPQGRIAGDLRGAYVVARFEGTLDKLLLKVTGQGTGVCRTITLAFERVDG